VNAFIRKMDHIGPYMNHYFIVNHKTPNGAPLRRI
jgi:hypothetical protein